jgi:hypothetical protein
MKTALYTDTPLEIYHKGLIVQFAFVGHAKVGYSMLSLPCVIKLSLWPHKAPYITCLEFVVGLNSIQSIFESEVERREIDDIKIRYSIAVVVNVY